MVEEWRVFFYGREYPPGGSWIVRLLHRDYAHCIAVGWSGDGWVCIQPHPKGIQVARLSEPLKDQHDLWRGVTKTLPARVRSSTPLLGFGTWTCVSVIKGLIGVSLPFVQTPKQLADWLEANN